MINGKILQELLTTMLTQALQEPQYISVKQHLNQTNIALTEALNEITPNEAGLIKVEALRKIYFEKLRILIAANDAWKNANFDPSKRPSNHIAAEVGKRARAIFETCAQLLAESVELQRSVNNQSGQSADTKEHSGQSSPDTKEKTRNSADTKEQSNQSTETKDKFKDKSKDSTKDKSKDNWKDNPHLLLFDNASKKSGKKRTELYRESRDIVLKGSFQLPDGTTCTFDPKQTKEMQQNTKVYKNPPPLSEEHRRYSKTIVEVILGDTLDVLQFMLFQGYNPVGLNMAHARSPGGGASNEGGVQEESIYRRMDYFLSLEMEFNPVLKQQMQALSDAAGGKKPLKYKIPVVGGIYSPHVTVFRKSEAFGDELIIPFSIAMIAASAHNPYEGGHKLKQTLEAFREGTENKFRAILRIAAIQGHDSVVLSAFGCGAFIMDKFIKDRTSKVVAEAARKVIQEPEFNGVFRNIAFAIYDNPSSDVFYDFQERLNFEMEGRPKNILG